MIAQERYLGVPSEALAALAGKAKKRSGLKDLKTLRLAKVEWL